MSIDFTGDIYRNSIRNYWNINASVSCDGIIISVGNISRATIFKFRIRGHDDYCPTGRVTPIKRNMRALKDFYAPYGSKPFSTTNAVWNLDRQRVWSGKS